jgi:hypothetical protein
MTWTMIFPGEAIMTRARFHLLMTDPKTAMTGAERLEWHFCKDFNARLIHNGEPRFKSCRCVHGAMIRREGKR